MNNNAVNLTEMITKIEKLRCDDVMNNDWINNGKNTRTSFVASSKHFEKIINSRSNRNKLLFIGLNESSHQELFNQSIFFEKFQIFQKLSWKN